MKFSALVFAFWLLALDLGYSENLEHPPVAQSGYVEVDGGALYFQRFGSGEPIIVLHGGPGMDQGYLLPQMLELAKDHEVIFYDQRGCGKSLNTEINPQSINIERFAEDLEQVKLNFKFKKFILIGHSWGCVLAMNYATKHQDAVSGLILLNPAPADTKGIQAFYVELVKRIDPIKNSLQPLFKYEDFERLEEQQIHNLYRMLFSVYFYEPKNLEYLTLKMDKISAQSGFKCREILNSENINLFPVLKLLKVPTLIIHGNQDIVSKQISQEIKEAIPNTQIIYLDECSHFAYIEKPNEVFSAIREFLVLLRSKWVNTDLCHSN